MSRKMRLAYFAHALRSDWNNGNAHFLRGLVRAMGAMGHTVTVFEPETGWSIDNLHEEPLGARSLSNFSQTYPDLHICTYSGHDSNSGPDSKTLWRELLGSTEIVIVHEWNDPALAARLLALREELGFRLLFHDTHHRASSTPEQIDSFRIGQFDGVVVFGEALRTIYCERFGIERVWTLHEAADTSVFHPQACVEKQTDVVWVGNWGEGERAAEIDEYLLAPARQLGNTARFTIHGVRYPETGLAALREAGVSYRGYLPNLDAPAVYGSARLTLHIPRQQYVSAMKGIPTIRVFETLASGIPLISAPWEDTEDLFRPGDFCAVAGTAEMTKVIRLLLHEPAAAKEQARRGLEQVLARHTCNHRAVELTRICEEVLS